MPQYDHLDLDNWPSNEAIVRHDLQPYFDAVVKEVARHIPEKGFGYRNKEWLGYFIERVHKLAFNYVVNPDNSGEALDIGAMAAFSWLHQTDSFPLPKPTSQFTHEERRGEYPSFAEIDLEDFMASTFNQGERREP